MGYIGAGVTRFNTADELTVTGDAQIDTTTLVVDSTNNRVGIGTTSPDQTLVVKTADGGGIAIENAAGNQYRWAVNNDDSFAVVDSGTAERLRIDSSGNVGIGESNPSLGSSANGLHITGASGNDGVLKLDSSDTTHSGKIQFTENGTDQWRIAYDPTNNHLEFTESGVADRMVIADGGNVGISNTSPAQKLAVGGTASGTVALQVTNSTAGTAFNNGMQMFINDTAGGLNMRENYPLQIYVNGAERARFLAGGGITFNGDTAAANALDDYEEGTFTPTLIATGGSLSVTYGSANGRYTKIGNVVHIAFQLRVNAHSGGSNEYRVGGLPFNASNPNSDHVGVSTAGLESHPIGSTEQLIQVIDHNSTQVRLLKAQNNTGWGVYTPSSSMSVFMSFTYPVA